jgi:hypothetical protein
MPRGLLELPLAKRPRVARESRKGIRAKLFIFLDSGPGEQVITGRQNGSATVSNLGGVRWEACQGEIDHMSSWFVRVKVPLPNRGQFVGRAERSTSGHSFGGTAAGYPGFSPARR